MFIVIFFICLCSTYANHNCDVVIRGNYISEGYEKIVYEGTLGDKDVVIKEAKIDGWRTIENRYQNYLSLHTEYYVLKSLENDYPNYSMKIYGYCNVSVPFYIMERGESITQHEMYKEPLRRMLQRNFNASEGMLITLDIKWNQLVKKGNEIYTIDVNMGDIYDLMDEGHNIEFEEYYRMYTWQLYCKIGDLENFSLHAFPGQIAKTIPPGEPMRCDNDPLRFRPSHTEDYVPNGELSYELMPDECTRVIIDKKIGQGAEKTVYNGTLDGKDVAIKEMHKIQFKIHRNRNIDNDYRISLNLYEEFVAMQAYYSAYPDIAFKPYAFCVNETNPYYIIDLGYRIPVEDRNKYRLAIKDMVSRMIEIGLYARDFAWKQLVVKNDTVQCIDTGGVVIRDKATNEYNDKFIQKAMNKLFMD